MAKEDPQQVLAKKALDLQTQSNKLSAQLDLIKDELRNIANGNTLEIIVSGYGKINITKPREGGEEKVSLILNESKLSEDMKAKLLAKGICEQKITQSAPAKASVVIKPNV